MERAYVRDCVGTCSQVHSECEHRECAVDMHVPPIKGTPRVKFKVLDGTEPTLSMPMLVANGNRVILRGEVAKLVTAKPRRWWILETIGTWRCWLITLPSSYILMCGHYVIRVHQVEFGIWARRWNNGVCENRPARRTMRTVVNRCNYTSTVWWVQ